MNVQSEGYFFSTYDEFFAWLKKNGGTDHLTEIMIILEKQSEEINIFLFSTFVPPYLSLVHEITAC